MMNAIFTDSEQEKNIYTVSQLNEETRLLLENHFTVIWVEGEISNLSQPSSGHVYFSLKDEKSQIRCAMFRSQKQMLGIQLSNGMQILARAKVSLYQPRGDYQLIVNFAETLGDGMLRRQYEILKLKLEQEGLFSQQYKSVLPPFPRCIGVITSPTGAAIRDILTTLKRRAPHIPVIIYPCEVQGATAAEKIIQAIQSAEEHQACDVLLLARGGGSLEDLWCFNEESLARAIFKCQLPIVTGIGHEIDFTIADFVADDRAPTPTAAAEMVSPEHQELTQRFSADEQRMLLSIERLIGRYKSELQHFKRHLQAPRMILQQQAQAPDFHEVRLLQAYEQSLSQKVNQVNDLATSLNAMSPLATLSRGYAIIKNKQDEIIRDSAQVKIGEMIDVHLHQGQLICYIDQIK